MLPHLLRSCHVRKLFSPNIMRIVIMMDYEVNFVGYIYTKEFSFVKIICFVDNCVH